MTTEKPLREQFEDELRSKYEKLIKVVDDNLEATKKVRVQRACQKCGCKHIEFVEIPNHDAALKAAEFLSNRGIGRPGAEEAEDSGEKVVVNLTIR